MPTLTEGQHKAEFIVSEANGDLSRETVTVLMGQNLQAGHVVGKVTVGTVSAAAASGNTGNGTIGTLSAGTGAKPGVYQAVCIEPATNSGTFNVEDPDGVSIGHAVVGSAFAGAVGFTIADGATDFAAGDRFLITVAEGSDKYKEYNPANTDGSQVPAGLLLDNVDATDADQTSVAVVREAEVNANELVWFSGATDNQKSAALAQLKDKHIIARPAV
jgi:hypothetical protein